MSWSQNARRPANGIMWTLFFAGRDFAPGLNIDGVNVQDYMLDHYLGAQREIAQCASVTWPERNGLRPRSTSRPTDGSASRFSYSPSPDRATRIPIV